MCENHNHSIAQGSLKSRSVERISTERARGRLLLIFQGHMDANTLVPVNASPHNASDEEQSLSGCVGGECMDGD